MPPKIDIQSSGPWLNRFAWFTAVATLVLISIGGIVTSKGVGMAVPDWPTTYGYNMFLFPFHKWQGGIFYEHSHRLVGSAVGLFTVILCVWLWIADKRQWLKWLGTAALILVIVQGVLGGLRVTKLKDELGIFHGVVAQVFFLMTVMIGIVTTRSWATSMREWVRAKLPAPGVQKLLLGTTVVILFQLMLGATMRHQHSGLAVPDFPLAHGQIYPRTDEASIRAMNQKRLDARVYNEITAVQVHLHMAHRMVAIVIVVLVGMAWSKLRKLDLPPVFRKLAHAWLGLIALQFILGAVTVLSNKAADIATAHVVCGALSLCVGFTLVLLSRRLLWEHSRPISAARPAGAAEMAVLAN